MMFRTPFRLMRGLLGDDARWVTGVVLPIDAGATAISSTPSPVK